MAEHDAYEGSTSEQVPPNKTDQELRVDMLRKAVEKLTEVLRNEEEICRTGRLGGQKEREPMAKGVDKHTQVNMSVMTPLSRSGWDAPLASLVPSPGFQCTSAPKTCPPWRDGVAERGTLLWETQTGLERDQATPPCEMQTSLDDFDHMSQGQQFPAQTQYHAQPVPPFTPYQAAPAFPPLQEADIKVEKEEGDEEQVSYWAKGDVSQEFKFKVEEEAVEEMAEEGRRVGECREDEVKTKEEVVSVAGTMGPWITLLCPDWGFHRKIV